MVNIELKNEPIKLKFRPYHKEAEVFHKFSVNFNIDEPVELKYYNPFEEKEEIFYVFGFEIYSLEKYVQSIEENDKYKDVPKEHIDGLINRLANYFDDLERKNSSLVLMNYEADRGLYFHSTEFLDRKIEISSNSSSESMGFIFKPEKTIGEHGMKLFIASFQDVPNDLLETLEFELHSVNKQYHGQTLII